MDVTEIHWNKRKHLAFDDVYGDCCLKARAALYMPALYTMPNTRGYPIKFALGYLVGAHLRFYLLVFKSDPLDECEYTS